MRDLLQNLVTAGAGRADYADARWVSSRAEEVSVRNGALEQAEHSEREGIGVRVRVGGAWGFASARGTSAADAEAALARALAVAEAQPPAPAVSRTPEPPARGTFVAPAAGRDPFDVALEEKLETLLAADAAMSVDPRLAVTRAHFVAFADERVFASSEGALCEQKTVECGGGISATSVEGDEAQTRSFPASFRGNVAQAGYEHFLELDLVENAPGVGEEAVALLSAPACPAGRSTLILDGEQLALQVHESVGHAIELDRILGFEASYAGTSFLSPTDLGRLRYGSELMNVTADATLPGGLGSFGWDDEGVAARRLPIVRGGVLQGFLSSRDSAGEAGLERSGACMRASGFDRQPLVRMTNVSLDPGDAGSLDDLVASTERGILMSTNRSWSIDSRRLQFQFGTEAAWEIVDGERRRLLRNPTYAGVTPKFWAGLDAVCSPEEWRLWGVINCGKGEPGQLTRVSHGTAPARFRDVQVGIA